jgi:hypothetical protein
LAGGTTLPSENPDRLWPFILTDHQRRNKAVEQSVAKEQDFSAYLENQILGKEAILCVREKHFDKLLCLLETELVAHHRPGK